jgi:hypothetical protein
VTTVFLILFVIVTAVLLMAMFAESLGDHKPSACPPCGSPDREIGAGGPLVAYDRWYRPAGARFRCRDCQTYFKNHPNGTFVENRE